MSDFHNTIDASHAMSSSKHAAPTRGPNLGKLGRYPAGRVVPVVPLSLSRPARPQSKIEVGSKPTDVNENGQAERAINSGLMPAQHPTVETHQTPTHDVSGTSRDRAKSTQWVEKSEGEENQAKHMPVLQESEFMSASAGAPRDQPPGNEGEKVDSSCVVEGPRESLAHEMLSDSVSARKPTDHYGVRQIRTELPPAFVPSAETHTPHSASSSRNYTQPPGLPQGHPTHPSNSSIVSGGHGSSGSSPAPPSAVASGYAPLLPAQMPSFHDLHYHGPEVLPQRVSHPSYLPRPLHLGSRQSYGPHPPQLYYPPPAGHVPFRYPPRETFTPGNAHQPNGHGLGSRNGSHASSNTADSQRPAGDQSAVAHDEQVDATRVASHQHRVPLSAQGRYHSHVPQIPMNFALPEDAVQMGNSDSLCGHVQSQFNNPELADCHLQISEELGYGRQYLEGHRIILSRSPTLLSIIRSSEQPESASLKTQIHILLKGQYLQIGLFVAAVRYLYGVPLPAIPALTRTFRSKESMEVALQEVAMGAWLQLPAVAQRGLEMTTSVLEWDTVPLALAFGLDGGLSPLWTTDDGNEEKISICSSDDSLNRSGVGCLPTYQPYSSEVLHRLVDFAVHNFPSDFYLDSAAPQLPQCPRLPAAQTPHESRSVRADPRLSKIRFGEVPMNEHPRPSSTTTSISSTLISLPFQILKFVLEHPVFVHRLGRDTASSIMRQVINEREVRRQQALQNRSVSADTGTTDASLLQNLLFEEGFEESLRVSVGFRLVRKRRDNYTPSSSSTESEQVK